MAVISQATARSCANDAQPWNLVTLLTNAAPDQGHRERGTWIGTVVCLGLFAILFEDTLGNFYYHWTTDENYSHGFLVPLISLYFANLVARRGPVPIRGGEWLGGLLLLIAVLVRLFTIPLPIPFLGDMAFLIGLAGGFTALFGTTALRCYWFAFFFLVFMVPLPIALYSKIASPLQLLASRVASAVMNATGVPVLCEGNKMTLPGGVQMFVAEACSGMRQLTGFLALTTAVAYLSARPAWYRAVIVVSALPIALTANIARVVLTGYIMHFVNPQYAAGAFHTVEGLVMMGFGLLLLQSECWILDRISGRGNEPAPPGAPTDPVRCEDLGSKPSRFLGIPGRDRASRPESSAASAPPIGDADRVHPRRAHVTTSTYPALRSAPVDRAGGPGRPGADQSDGTATAASTAVDDPDPAGRLDRRRSARGSPNRGAGPDHRIPQPDLREPQTPGTETPALGELFERRDEPAPHAGDLPAGRGMDQDRVPVA
jgi:exosortase